MALLCTERVAAQQTRHRPGEAATWATWAWPPLLAGTAAGPGRPSILAFSLRPAAVAIPCLPCGRPFDSQSHTSRRSGAHCRPFRASGTDSLGPWRPWWLGESARSVSAFYFAQTGRSSQRERERLSLESCCVGGPSRTQVCCTSLPKCNILDTDVVDVDAKATGVAPSRRSTAAPPKPGQAHPTLTFHPPALSSRGICRLRSWLITLSVTKSLP